MCVIIVKQSNVKMPSKALLTKAANKNPDGFGFCTANKYFKTLNYKTFIKELEKVDISESCIIHFRFATIGGVKESNCHPFKRNNVYFAHNGTIYGSKAKNDTTDSETFFISEISPIIDKYGLDSEQLDFLLSVNGWSKFALMQGTKIRLFGSFQKMNDLYFSNLYFL